MKKNALILALILIGVGGIILVIGFYKFNFTDGGNTFACTEEAKLCSDGSAVGREGPNCEFPACPEINSIIPESQARMIAETTCIKGGESLSMGIYNAGTKTWWFDANLNSTKDGCNPACVVSEETETAEINWRCTGLIAPNRSAEDIQKIFVDKYPKYAKTLQISVNKEVPGFARGEISFEPGQPGGGFLSYQKDGVWTIAWEGNGMINCGLKKHGFPADFLVDCAE